MTTLQKHIRDLIFFYVKTNYEKYLQDNNLTKISDESIPRIIDELYSNRKGHIQMFIKDSLPKIIQEEHPGDAVINTIIREIFEDDELCKTRIIVEIQTYQKSLTK